MRNYDRVHPRKPDGIENRKAYIVGGGIAGLSAAAFLVRDAQMPGENITVYDQLPVFGGSMDGCGNAETGYICRGERELEPYMECLWDLFSTIPSIYEEGRTVLDETRECNQQLEINAKHRLYAKNMVPFDESTMNLTPKCQEQLMKMLMTPEEQLENMTIKEWFDSAFFQSNLWYYWEAMLAFGPQHSLIEMRRYAIRFMHQLHLIKSLKQILRTKYDQYNSLILPLVKYLQDHNVNFVASTTVVDMDLDIQGTEKTVIGLHLVTDGKETVQPVAASDLVYFTNGSMTQNSTRGSMTEAPVMNTDTKQRGCFSLWEKLAAKADCFGHPEKFISDTKQSSFVTCSVTVKDYPELIRYIERKSEVPAGTNGFITFPEAPWFIIMNVPLQPAFPDQPDNVAYLITAGFEPNNPGAYIKKPMTECSGKEIMQELLYWCGLEDKADEIIRHSIAIPSTLPYITSQFMPRAIKDRPTIIPDGCTNLALIGQFVELPGDVVFTVETSVRTAMTAVYRTLHLDRPVDPLFQGQYDIRMVKAGVLTLLGKDKVTIDDLPEIDPFKLPETMQQLIDAVNDIPEVPAAYSERWENR